MKQRSLLLAALGLAIGAAHADNTKIESLARSCNSSHGLNGVSAGPPMPSIGGISPVNMEDETQLKLQRKLESRYVVGWFKNIMADAFA
jgi:hypothetical protein